MSEETLPKPFPEARPPHLPDVVTRQSPWLLMFLAVAALVAWRAWTSWGPSAAGEEVSSFIGFVTFASSILAPPLFGVAVFARHPDARVTMPLLVFGLGLMAAGSLLTAFGEQIRDLLRGSAGFLEFQTPGETAFLVLSGLVAVFGVLYVAAGLSSARRAARARLERPVTIWLAALSVVNIVFSLRSLTEIVGRGEYTPDMVIAIAIGVVLSILSTLAWLYLTAVVVNGFLAGEAPGRGWLAAAIGVLMLFVSPLVVGFVFVASSDGNSALLPFFNYATLAAWVLLLVAFALGMPTPAGSSDREAVTADPQGATQPGS